mgnify:CR=1 FL=1
MYEFDPSKLVLAERGKIAQRARRNVGSEVTLILTAGFAVLAITLLFVGDFTFLPLAEQLQLRPTIVWIGMAVLISLLAALVHGWFSSGIVARARKHQFLVHQFDEAQRRAETEKKANAFK